MAIPLLAALVLVNRQESFRRRRATSVLVATFWHILWIAGVVMLVSGLVAVAVHTVGYTQLERGQDPGDSGS